jgi:hypothetical protein
MPLIKPSFTIPGNIRGVSGQYGPWINTNLSKDQKYGLGMLLFVSLAFIILFTAVSFIYARGDFSEDNKKITKDYAEKCENETNTSPENLSFGEFLNGGVDAAGFFMGLGAGLIFGFIDNAGLFYGMSYLDPVFSPEKVPWVYGKGGRRYYTGLDSKGELLYKNTKFTDGFLSEKEQIDFKHVAHKIGKDYKNQLKLSEDVRERINTNEAAYADPGSGLFLGKNMSKREFFNNFKNRKVGEKTYYEKIDFYKRYKKNDLRGREKQEKTKRLKIMKEMHSIKTGTRRFIGKRVGKNISELGLPIGVKEKIRKLENDLLKSRPWPGADKSLAEASLDGWTPGSLSQAGIGNTFSDFLGSFLSTFIGSMILISSGMCTTSLLSEVLGVTIGCLLGLMFGKSSFTPGTKS